MPLRIAFDMDGVLANMNTAVDRIADSMFDEPDAIASARASADRAKDAAGPERVESPLDAASDRAALTPRQQSQLSRRINAIENFWETLDELEPGSVARLWEIAVERRWEVIFLTKRPETAGATPQLQTQRWLQRQGFPLPSVFVVAGSRGRIASALALDFVIDDRPDNCLDVVLESSAKAILVWREGEAALPDKARRLGIAVVPSLAQCFDTLTRIDGIPDKPGMIARIARLLGLERESPAV